MSTTNKESKSEFGQDLWVLEQHGKHQGFFIEFGARDGVKTSNTWLLEKKYNWRGILVECDSANIARLRNSGRAWSTIAPYAVAKYDGVINFNIGVGSGTGSTYHLDAELHTGKTVSVPCYRADSILNMFNAPYIIDYISVDVEGAEMDVLETFAWNKHKVTMWTIECTDRRNHIIDIMEQRGYNRFEQSVQTVDEWFILKE